MSNTFIERFRAECVEGSKIDSGLYGAATQPIIDTGRWEVNYELNRKVSRFWINNPPINFGDAVGFYQESDELFCLKAEFPREETEDEVSARGFGPAPKLAKDAKRKVIKYETPLGKPLAPFTPAVDASTWYQVAKCNGLLDSLPPEVLTAHESVNTNWCSGKACSFWEWIKQHPEIKIVLVEGAKKALSLLSIGIVAIGLNGCRGAYFRVVNDIRALRTELLPYVTGRDVCIALDQDEKAETRATVQDATEKTARILAEVCETVTIAVWQPEQGKGPDDVRVQSGDDAIEQAIANAAEFTRWQRANRKASNLERAAAALACTYPAEVVLNKRFLSPADIPALNPGDILALSSAVETGKTELSRAIVAAHQERFPKGWIIFVGSRNSLLHQTGQRMGVPHIQQLDRDYNGDIGCAVRQEKGVLLCLDSLPRIRWDDLPANSLIVFDEGEALAVHGLGGGTLGDRQNEILSLWRSVCCRVLATGGNLILAEDSLTDIGLNFYKELTRQHYPLRLVRNDFKHDKVVQLSRCSAGAFTGRILASLAEGKRIVVSTDSQAFGEQLDRVATILGYRVYRLDSKTADMPESKGFQLYPNEFLAENDYHLVILSPTAESGVNITVPGFHVYASLIASDCRSQFQQLNRVRNPESITVRTAVRAPVSDHAASTSPQAILKNNRLSSRITANLTGLRAEIEAENWSSDAKTQLERLDQTLSESDSDTQFWNEYIAKFQARANLLRSEVEGNFEKYLDARGFKVQRIAIPHDKDAAAKIRLAKLAIEADTASELDKLAGGQSESIAISILSSPSSTYKQRLNAEKSLLQHKLPGAELSEAFLLEMAVADRGKGLKTAVLLWNCQHPEICKKLDRTAFRNQLSRPWVNGFRLTHHTQKATLFEYLGLQALIDKVESGEQVAEESPEVQFTKERAIAEANAMRRLTRLNITPEQTGIHIADKLLRQFGYDLRKARRIGSRGDRHSTFTVVSTYSVEHRQQVFEALNRKWAEDLNDSEKSVSPICNTENTLMQMGDTGTPPPLDPPKISIASVGTRVRFAADGSECQVERVENGLVTLKRLDQFVKTATFTALPEELEAAA